MIRASMRVQQTQAPPLLKFTSPGTFYFDRTAFIAAGYTNYELMVVGAAGGRAGDARGDAPTNINRVFGAGGGGGGSIKASGLLTSLSSITTLVVGSTGSIGAVGGEAVKAGDGGDGGNSSFGSLVAYGGKGATGGKVSDEGVIASHPTYSLPSIGGDGGGNSGSYGAAGDGGEQGYSHRVGSDYVYEPAVNPTNGTGTVNGGCGAGGGGGRFTSGGTIKNQADPGANGAVGSGFDSSGGSPVGNNGGTGGGANIQPITGVAEYFGGGTGYLDGVVVIKLS